MAQTLQLEYTCTKAERSEAQSLALRKNIGRGSRTLTLVVLFGVVIFVGAAFCFEIQTQTPRALRPYIYIAVFVLFVFFFLKNRKALARSADKTRLEVTDSEFTIVGPNTRLAMVWSSFSDCIESSDLFVLIDRTKAVLFIIPKRAFPSESWQTWFRNLATNRPQPAAQAEALPLLSQLPAGLKLHFQLGLRDYADRASASYFTWAAILFFVALFHGSFIYAMATADPSRPRAFTTTQMSFMVLIPFIFLMSVGIFLIATIKPWWAHRKVLTSQDMIVSQESLGFVSADGTGVVPWTTYKYYKETGRSFILWRGVAWVLIPKRAIASADDVDRCRVLLASHLQRGRWFY